MSAREIQLSHYDYDLKETVSDGEVSVRLVAKSMTNENMAQLLDNHLNSFDDQYKKGLAVGEMLHHTHRTLQASVGRWALGILIGLGRQKYTDARNEKIVALGQKLDAMIESGELNMGWMI